MGCVRARNAESSKLTHFCSASTVRLGGVAFIRSSSSSNFRLAEKRNWMRAQNIN